MTGLITNYLGRGLAAARPASPTIATGSTAFFIASDTGVISAWNGSWQTVGSGGGGVTDGDKGHIVVSGGGATWEFDSTVVTTFALSLLDDANASTMRSTLGLGTAALSASTDFAATSHTHSISNVTGLQTAIDGKQASLGFTAENAANKGIADGYASLDSSGKVPSAQLPSFVDDVLEYADLASLPVTGEANKIYVTIDNNKTFRWSGSAYVEITSSPGSTDAVVEGSVNLYFTTARVLATSLTGFSTSTNSVVLAADSILAGMGKLQAQINSHFGSGGASHADATTSTAGFMSSTDKTKLDGIASGATVVSNSDIRAQTEAQIAAGTNITVVPSGTGATRVLTLSSLTSSVPITFAELTVLPGSNVVYFVTDGVAGSSPVLGGGLGCLAVWQNGAWRSLAVGTPTLAHLAAGGRKPTIATMGDSLGEKLAGVGIQYCLEAFYAADIVYDKRIPASGGRQFGQSAQQLTALAGQVVSFAANPADVVFICNRPNDTFTTHAGAVTGANLAKAAALGCFAAGASQVYLHGSLPREAATGTPYAYMEYNSMLRAFANVTDGVGFIDTTEALIKRDQTSTTQMQWRGPANATAGAYRVDDVHPSRWAIYDAIAPLYAPIFRQIARERRPRATFPVGTDFDQTNFPYIDLMNDAGLMLGTGGQLNNVNNTNVPGATGTVWDINHTIGSGLVVTPSIVTGADGWKRMRATLSGTLTADSYVTFDLETAITLTAQAGRKFDMEAIVELTGVNGLRDHYLTCTALQTTGTPFTTNLANNFPDGFTDELYMYTTWGNEMSGNNPEFRLQFYFASGTVMSGTIDIRRASVRQIS